MDNQTAFLTNIRTALGEAPNVERSRSRSAELFSSPDPAGILRTIRNRSVAEQDRLVAVLRENGDSLNISSHLVASFTEAAAVVVELIRSKEPEFNHTKHVVLHDHPDIAALQLWNRFNREAVTLHTTFSRDRQIKDKTIASFIGITAPTLGVADSATLLQLTEPGRPRSTSLLPSIHIALLKRENVVADLTEAYVLLGQKSNLGSFVFITGPSKTADIEAYMVHGAHGPREVHLIVLAEPPAGHGFQEADEEVFEAPAEETYQESSEEPAKLTAKLTAEGTADETDNRQPSPAPVAAAEQ
jgi:L-lactate dehydrogenase complex protein LldG